MENNDKTVNFYIYVKIIQHIASDISEKFSRY